MLAKIMKDRVALKGQKKFRKKRANLLLKFTKVASSPDSESTERDKSVKYVSGIK
jgi:hypothetical protein